MNGKRARCRVALDPDLKLVVRAHQLRMAKRFKTQPVQCVRRVGNEFPQKNVSVRVQRMNHQVQNLASFCLELESFDVRSHDRQCNEVRREGSSGRPQQVTAAAGWMLYQQS